MNHLQHLSHDHFHMPKNKDKLVNMFVQLQLTIGALVRSKQLELVIFSCKLQHSSDSKLM